MRGIDLDLEDLRKPLEVALGAYTSKYGGMLTFGEFDDFKLTPEKPNTARTAVPVTFDDSHVGGMSVIVFLEGDGTGDENTYTLPMVLIPADLWHNDKPERVIPRAKTGVVYEGCFPMFSITDTGFVAMHAAALDELIVTGVPLTVAPQWRLGQTDSGFKQAIYSGLEILPEVYLTVGPGANDQRFGDPHSVYSGIRASGGPVQVAGFLGIKDQGSPICQIARGWSRPMSYERSH